MLRKSNPGRKQVQLALRRKALKERFIGWFIPVQSSVSQVMELAEVPPYPEILFELSNSVSSESEFNDCKSKSIQDQLFNETLPLRHEAVGWDRTPAFRVANSPVWNS